jgi:hypothetical protein
LSFFILRRFYMSRTAPKTSKFSHKHALKSALVLGLIALVFTLLIAGAGIANDKATQEAARQTEIQRQEDERVEREKAAEAAKTRAAYDKCIQDANDSYGPALDKIPPELYGAARVEAIRLIGEKVESFKDDCDRQYNFKP